MSNELSGLIDKIKLNTGLSQQDIAEKLGYDPQYLSQLLNGHKKVSPKTIEKVKQYFPRETLNEPEKPYLVQRRDQKNHHEPYLVPLIPVKAQAGYVRAIDQEFYLDTLEKYALPPGIQPQGATWAYWEVQGDSMEPNFVEGDIILTSLMNPMDWQDLRNFYVHVVVLADQVCIKRIFRKSIEQWVLISDNEDQYEQKLINITDVKQVWLYRKTWASRAKPPKMFEIKV